MRSTQISDRKTLSNSVHIWQISVHLLPYSLSPCLSVSLSPRLSVPLTVSVSLSLRLSLPHRLRIFVSLSLSLCLSVSPSLCPSLSLYARVSLSVGYACVYFVISPTQLGWPHRRERVWFICVDRDWLRSAGWSDEKFREVATAIWERFVSYRDFALTSLDAILLPESHPIVERTREEASEAARTSWGFQCVGLR